MSQSKQVTPSRLDYESPASYTDANSSSLAARRLPFSRTRTMFSACLDRDKRLLDSPTSNLHPRRRQWANIVSTPGIAP